MLRLWRRRWFLDVIIGLPLAFAIRQLFPDSAIRRNDATGLYTGVIQASAALAALAITAVAIVLALTQGPRLRALLRYHAAAVRVAMLWTVVANLSAVAIGIVGLSSDTTTDPVAMLRVLAVGIQFAALLAMLRLVWFFVSLLELNEVDQEAV